METLNKPVLILGIIAVMIIGVNLTIFIGFFSTSMLSRSTPYYKSEDTSMPKFTISPYAGELATIDDQGKQTISVSGIGMAKAKPDRALVSLSVITRADNAKNAVYENAEKMSIVIGALKAMGIAEKQIETSAYSLTPIWDYSDRNTPRITGYTCQNTITVVITDLNRIGEVIDGAITAGVNQVSHIQFTVSDETMKRLEKEALRNAVEDAESKAKLLADAAGVAIVRLISISISSRTFESTRITNLSEGAVSTLIIPPEEVSVTISISALYEFR
ncbi:MAG: SIMPL domain-containing protein [Thermoproteota archaeon]|nr:SIMPL domain-containing protein [Candidatus Brockarchaeota archaeon]